MSDQKMNKYVFQSIYTFLYALQFVLSMLVVSTTLFSNIFLLQPLKDAGGHDIQRAILRDVDCRGSCGAFHVEPVQL